MGKTLRYVSERAAVTRSMRACVQCVTFLSLPVHADHPSLTQPDASHIRLRVRGLQELDEAVLRRLPKRIYVPLPDATTRRALLAHLLSGPHYRLPPAHLDALVQRTEGYSGSDLAALAREAAMEPLRELPPAAIATVQASKARALSASTLLALRLPATHPTASSQSATPSSKRSASAPESLSRCQHSSLF